MTVATPSQESRSLPASQRWTGAVVGLFIGMAAVCHGCHVGDRDDELSLTRESQGERRALCPPVQTRRDEPGGLPSLIIESEALPPATAPETSRADLSGTGLSAPER